MSPGIFTIKAKLGDLFPADDPNSPWLLRLAILRDDFEYEIVPKGDREGDLSGVWMSFYWWRKRAITIGEVKHIFCHDVANYVKCNSADWRPEFVEKLKESIRAVEEADRAFGPIRDALGAHVRPENAVRTKPKADPTPKVLQRHC